MTLAIIQARLNSKRFPCKVLELIGDKTMVARVTQAAQAAKYVNDVSVAWAENFKNLDEDNVLGRFKAVVEINKPDVVVRLTSDCPLLTGEIIDEAIHEFENSLKPYYCNRKKYPSGYDVQVFDAKVLSRPYWTHREHVIHPRHVPNCHEEDWSVNTPEDLERVRKEFERKEVEKWRTQLVKTVA